MLNVGGSVPRRGPLVHGLMIACNMSGRQTTFVSGLVLLISLSNRGPEGTGGRCQASQVSIPCASGGANLKKE